MRTKDKVVKAIRLGQGMDIEVIELPEAEHMFQRMQQAIHCTCVGIGNFKYLEQMFRDLYKRNYPDYCIVYDDEAMLKPNFINSIASFLYGFQDHGHVICGETLIMRNKMTLEGMDNIGLTDEDIQIISERIKNAIAEGQIGQIVPRF